MRRRSQTSSSCKHVNFEQPQFLREEYQRTKIELSILRSKYESLEKQRDILKQGNSHLIEEFLFNKHREELNRLQREVAQKTEENTELKKIIGQLEEMVKTTSEITKDGTKELKKFDSVKRFSIRLQNDTKIIANKESSIGHELKVQLKDLLDNYKKLAKGSSVLHVLNRNKEKAKDNEQNESKATIKLLESQRDQFKEHAECIQKQFKAKITELTMENSDLRQKISQMTTSLIKEKTNCINQSLLRSKQMDPILNLNDYPIPMTASLCHTQELQKSIIYERFSEPSVMQSSIVTESYDKKISKLEKTNSMLEKDNQASKDKIKTLNRDYSKLKLDYLKVEQDKKRFEENHERKIFELNGKVQALNKKIKDLEIVNEKTRSQKNKQKQSYKSIISQHQSKIVQLEQKLQKNAIQISHFKQKAELSKKEQQKQTLYGKQLQNEKQRCKQLEKELEQRVANFQKSLKNYENIIEEMRKMSNNAVNKQGRKIERQNSSRSRQSSITKQNNNQQSSYLSPSQTSLLLTLQQQITILQSTIATQNQRYNILENSNKELRQRLMKMIQNEQKLRKQLIQERIKTRTNKSVSQSSKYSQRGGSVKKIYFAGETDNSRYGENNEIQSSEKLQQLKTNVLESQNLSSFSTNRNSQSYIQPYRTLTQSNSNRQIKSQTMIIVNKEEGKGSQMKMLRQRRFDPKETLETKKKQSQIKLPSNQQNYEPSYSKVEVQKNKSKTGKENNTASSPKYVYQPPKPKNTSSKQFSPSQQYSPQIPIPQPQSESKQISFEISESMSNLSKGDKIIQLLQINENSRLEESPLVNPFGENYYGSRYSKVKQEPSGAGKLSVLSESKREGSNIVMNGRVQQETKSNGDVRFTRKS